MSTFEYYTVGRDLGRAPIPLDEAVTVFVEHGPVRIGIGVRTLDFADLGLDSAGVCFHVLERSSGKEHLRFDCFDNDPHYHYLDGGSLNVIVAYDTEAFDDMLSWALQCIEERLPRMLRRTGATALADELPARTPDDVMQSIRDIAYGSVASAP